MSARKSWDVQRRPTLHAPASAPEPARNLPVRRSRAKAQPARAPGSAKRNVTIARAKPRRAPDGPSLKVRRQKARRLLAMVAGVAGLLLIAGLFYLFWLPALRIEQVHVEGPAAEDVERIARAKLAGTYFSIVPRNSLFFVPEAGMRKAVTLAHPEISSLSVKPAGLTGLSITAVPRARAFLWCGSAPDALETVGCYDADTEGLLFAPSNEVVASTSTAVLKVYAPLAGDALEPVRAHVSQASRIPDVLQFVKAMKTLGANIATVAFRGDEADLYTVSGTRITYVLGHEKQAAALAASAFPDLSVNDGSLEYVDLRFEGKVYMRRWAGASEE